MDSRRCGEGGNGIVSYSISTRDAHHERSHGIATYHELLNQEGGLVGHEISDIVQDPIGAALGRGRAK